MPLEVVVEACNRTIKAIHQPSFEYADKILQSWKSQGVMPAERARAAAEAHRPEKKERGTKAAELCIRDSSQTVRIGVPP